MSHKDMAEMYVGDDVSPDFYGWVFPKFDHVGVGTGTVLNRPAIKDYQVGLDGFVLLKRPKPSCDMAIEGVASRITSK